MIGKSIGPYQILAELGRGGMGEVYRARDTKLNRDVAIKVLPEAFAQDPERLARFTREAQTLAALNHPNIAAIYEMTSGVFSAGARSEKTPDVISHALVMELVEGRDLSEMIAGAPGLQPRGTSAGPKGPALHVPDALRIARQIADALEAAHEAGIVHRDLKPANVKVRSDGTVKVLDFGLARTLDAGPGTRDSSDAATMTSPAMTEAGMIMGTAAYMSPEQARGKPVDRRADIWAFGAVLYEMLTGRRTIQGETVGDMVAAVLRDDIDWSKLPATTPDSVKRLLMRCLERDLKQRLQAIGEARVVLEEATSRSGGMSVPPRPAPARVISRGWWLAVAAVIVAAAGAYALWPSKSEPPATAAASTSAGRAIAVLPFVNSSGNADDEYFADGMTDELIAGLGKVPGLHVAARSSAFSFKGQKVEIRDVAKKLGVDSILEGTVRRSGKRLRVTASLVNGADGLQIWSDTFENDAGDPFAVQDDVTRRVVSGLSLRLADKALAASQAGRTRDSEAHDLYLRGLASANAGSEADLRRALDFYQQAIARDPGFAQAHAGVAWVHVFLADAYAAPSEAYPKAKAAAQAALDLDDKLAEAYALRAYATAAEWRGQAGVDEDFRRALDLDPNSVNSLFLSGSAGCFSRQVDRGLAAIKRVTELDPLSPLGPLLLELCNYMAKRYPAVIEAHRRAQAINSSFVYLESWVAAAYRDMGDYETSLREYLQAEKALGGVPQSGLALTYSLMGREKDAREVMRRMDERARTHYVPYVTRAMVHAALGDRDEAVRLFEQAVEKRETLLFGFKNLPPMAPLLADPRARRILAQAEAMRNGK